MSDNTGKTAGFVRDSELDMRRQPLAKLEGASFGRRVSRLIIALLGTSNTRPFGSPRRSIDREQQQYSPSSN